MRLFLAIDLPDDIKAVLTTLQKPLAKLPGCKTVDAKQLHLTLKFLGDVEEKDLPMIIKSLETIRVTPFTLYLQHVGGFPTIARPRVIYMATTNPPPLQQVAKLVDLATKQILADKAFVPHITLARCKMPVKLSERDSAAVQKDMSSHSFNVTEYVLYSSVLGKEGPTYKVVRRFLLF